MTTKHECTEERFLKDVEKHELKILSDDGVYRTIKLADPENSNCYYMLTTWPGHLCISGDMGTYVFERTKDMFAFFRRQDMTVNHSYWHEKLQADSKFGGAREFSYELFEKTVLEDMEEYAFEHNWDDDEKALCLEELNGAVFQEDYSHCEDICQMGAYEFTYEATNGDKWDLGQDWESNCKVYTFHFTWILYAIVWGIQQYDAYQEKQNEPLERLKRKVAKVNEDLAYHNAHMYDLFNSGCF